MAGWPAFVKIMWWREGVVLISMRLCLLVKRRSQICRLCVFAFGQEHAAQTHGNQMCSHDETYSKRIFQTKSTRPISEGLKPVEC